jgi:hypothetical protein
MAHEGEGEIRRERKREEQRKRGEKENGLPCLSKISRRGSLDNTISRYLSSSAHGFPSKSSYST